MILLCVNCIYIREGVGDWHMWWVKGDNCKLIIPGGLLFRYLVISWERLSSSTQHLLWMVWSTTSPPLCQIWNSNWKKPVCPDHNKSVSIKIFMLVFRKCLFSKSPLCPRMQSRIIPKIMTNYITVGGTKCIFGKTQNLQDWLVYIDTYFFTFNHLFIPELEYWSICRSVNTCLSCSSHTHSMRFRSGEMDGQGRVLDDFVNITISVQSTLESN